MRKKAISHFPPDQFLQKQLNLTKLAIDFGHQIVQEPQRKISQITAILAEALKTRSEAGKGAHIRHNFRQAGKILDGLQEVKLERERLATRMEQLREEMKALFWNAILY